MQQHDDRVVILLYIILAHMSNDYTRLIWDGLAILLLINTLVKFNKQSSKK